MKAVVHIGMPKAGSTSIQTFLHVNRKALATRGIAYERHVPHRISQFEYPSLVFLRLGRLPDYAEWRHRYIGTSLDDLRQKHGPALEQLASLPARSSGHTAVISTEHAMVFLRHADSVQAFNEMLLEIFDSVRFVLYLRDPTRQMPSAFSEAVKRGRTLSLQTYIDESLPVIRPVAQITRWEKAVGRENLDVRLLEPEWLVGQDLLHDFADVIGASMDGLTRPPRANEALTAVGAKVLRSLNAVIPELLDDGTLNPLRTGLVQRVQDLTAEDPPLRPTAAQVKQIKRAMAPKLEQIRKARFPDRSTLFTEHDVSDPTPAAEIEDRSRQVLATLVRDGLQAQAADTGPMQFARNTAKQIATRVTGAAGKSTQGAAPEMEHNRG